MRILVTFENLLPSDQADAEQFVNNAAALARRGHYVDFLVPRKPDRAGDAVAEITSYYEIDAPLHIAELPSITSNVGLQHLHHAYQVTHDPRFHLADLLYTRNLGMLTASLAAGKPTVYEHYRPWPDQVPPMQPWLRGVMTHPKFVGMVLHSEFAKRSYARIGIPDEQLWVCHNGWEPRRMEPRLTQAEARERLGLPADRRIVVYTGRMNHKKGLDVALAMAARLPEHLFVLVGSTGEGPVERAARELPNVKVVPWQAFSGTAAYLYAADVVLVPPSLAPLLEHGSTVLPIKLFIYLASGRPILAADNPDVAGFLIHDENAVLVPPGDVETASRELDALLRDPARRQRLGDDALAKARTLTWDARAERISGLLERALGASRPVPGPWSVPTFLRETGEWAKGLPEGRWVRNPRTV